MDYMDFQEKIGYKFKDREILITALTHASYSNDHKELTPRNNERLEFFGDAIIEFVVSEYLFGYYNKKQEGDLTKIRAEMVCENALALCAKNIGLGDMLFLSNGEELTGGRERPSVTSDAFEALVAGIFLDGGIECAKEFIYAHLINSLKPDDLVHDAKSMFQVFTQRMYGRLPTYRIIEKSGPDHNLIFKAAVYIGNEQIATGKGHSKKDAEQAAAKEAYIKLSPKGA